MDVKKVQRPTMKPEVYIERSKHITNICNEYKTELLSETTYPRNLGSANILINTKDEFMWCKVPKAASASLTSLFTKIW